MFTKIGSLVMPKWMMPNEELPSLECGDRVLGIVMEAPKFSKVCKPTLIILEATETGWHCGDDTYAGYSVEDCVLWAYEKDVVQIYWTLFGK